MTDAASPPPEACPQGGPAPRTGLWARRAQGLLGRIGLRLLVVNFIVVLVPIVGIEFARVHERQLLESLERDMRNQAVLVRSLLETDLARGVSLPIRATQSCSPTPRAAHARAFDCWMPLAPFSSIPTRMALPRARFPARTSQPPATRPGCRRPDQSEARSTDSKAWPEVADRVEVRAALLGFPAARTRVRQRDPGVFLFLTEPIRAAGTCSAPLRGTLDPACHGRAVSHPRGPLPRPFRGRRLHRPCHLAPGVVEY